MQDPNFLACSISFKSRYYKVLVAMAWVNVLITYVVNTRLVLDYKDPWLVT
jgi:hypothetical protein